MLQQEIADLDFDTYFDVASNPMHSHHHQQMYHGDQSSIHPTQQMNMSRFNQPLPPPQQQQQYYLPQQQQQQNQQLPPPQPQSFEMFDWCFKQQQQQTQQMNPLHAQTPVSTPGGTNLSNQASPRSEYFYSTAGHAPPLPPPQTSSASAASISPRFSLAQNQPPRMTFKNEEITYGYMQDRQGPSPHNGASNTHLTPVLNTPPVSAPLNQTTHSGLSTPMSDVIFPGTPQSRASLPSSESNSPSSISEPATNASPSMDIPPPLTNAFATIDQWGKSQHDEVAFDFSQEELHETRHWRKTKRSDSSSSNTSNMVAAAVAAVAARCTPRTPIETGRQLKKVAHNAIERRYRNNINDRIRDLKNVVPALYKAKIREKKSNSSKSSSGNEEDSSDEEDGGSDHTGEIVDGVEVAKKLNKATILHKATEYIHHLKHTNELAERENQVLQQILAQMPGGAKVLARFQVQKIEFQQQEQQRLLAERKEAMEREKADRQRMLRERAAQRAALAELLPKPERRPYRRRTKKQQQPKKAEVKEGVNKSADSCSSVDSHIPSEKDTTTHLNTDNNNTTTTSLSSNTTPTLNAAGSNEPHTSAINESNKAFMAMFLCLAIVSPLSFENTTARPYHGGRALSQQQQILVRSLPSNDSISYWYWAKIGLFIMLFVYSMSRCWMARRVYVSQKKL